MCIITTSGTTLRPLLIKMGVISRISQAPISKSQRLYGQETLNIELGLAKGHETNIESRNDRAESLSGASTQAILVESQVHVFTGYPESSS